LTTPHRDLHAGAGHADAVHWSATISSRHGVVMTAIAGDGTGMERDYEFSSALHAADLAIWIRQF
jgi:hypothetical protein